jgi:NitT/TauT family transport system ATP-binding protein
MGADFLSTATGPVGSGSAEASEAIFEVRDVAVSFGSGGTQRPVLDQVSFSVAAGEIVGIVGPSGCGKTTLLRLLGGLLRPTSGSVLLQGEETKGPSGVAVTVFQDYSSALLPWRTVSRNVALPLEGRAGRAEIKDRVATALETVGLRDRGDEYPWRLSGGMQQRVQIARALVTEPQVLLMDEPFGALDAITKGSLHDQLLEVQSKTRATVVFITHDVEEAVYLSDRVMVINGAPGRIVHEVRSELPRPRDQISTRDLPGYHDIRHELAKALRDGRSA